MSDKKHIDRLFQEKFKDFEVTPDDAVWKRIEAQLKEKKKRRVVPIWWRYAGVAALLLLLLTIGNGYFNTNNITTDGNPNQVVDTDGNNHLNQTDNENNDDNHNTPNNNIIKNTDVITNNNASETDPNTSDNVGTTHKNENVLNPSNASSVANKASKNDGTIKNDDTVESIKNSINNNNLLQTKNNTENNIELANTSEDKTNQPPETNKAELDKTKIDNLFNTNKNSKESNIADVKTDAPEKTKTDSVTEQHQLTIEEAIEIAKNSNEEEKEDLNRWSVAPNAAPVFFNSLGKGSSIDPQFNNNSKSSETNMSYGVSASYAINNKISVRSGINKVNLGYNTNNVVAFQAIGGRSSISVLKNVKPELDNEANDISVLSTQNFADKSSQSFATTTGVNTSINQSLSFIEIPLEIKYLLSDKKLGINVIGGFSSFFLNGNELYSDFEGNKTLIGEASNINKTSYSANFGFGLDYKVSKKINLNLEPMFKYQINTFNNTSGDFKPYFIGVYTGFGIKF
ncbi:outer membrane beta-barrel protein [Confluentibacter flavum]|uniref:Uncharacterized protein n=1 Tax=Confluentibacter flavum TaxID=1909700 RepID=A0A2N3HL86_9FLAO|nr:outer membrane beta-barrel protein [Confluentibacter flavum]PKQ45713.1 hypothetical protein CSW08_06495 [Confluentibacter flavum]